MTWSELPHPIAVHPGDLVRLDRAPVPGLEDAVGLEHWVVDVKFDLQVPGITMVRIALDRERTTWVPAADVVVLHCPHEEW